jgi:UDP-glucose 4-epimerase
MEYVLVTGGLGFIGSHICVELLQQNYNVIVIDNLSNSKIETRNQINKITNKKFIFYNFDICDNISLNKIFKIFNITSTIHLAGLKSVNESISDPLLYYNTNITSTINLLKNINKHKIKKFIFSSSSTVYGSQLDMPLYETNKTGENITNPYGKSKYMIEEIISDFSKTSECKFIILRYFNPIGAHSSGLIGENPNNIPNNLMPYILRVVSGDYKELKIYGNNYNTPDGTCIRDFIHVVDLAKAHIKSLEYNNINNIEVFNIGTGKGTSVIELINTFIKVNQVDIPYVFDKRRDGDLPISFTNTDKANKLLNWYAEKNINDMCIDSYNFIKMNKVQEKIVSNFTSIE